MSIPPDDQLAREYNQKQIEFILQFRESLKLMIDMNFKEMSIMSQIIAIGSFYSQYITPTEGEDLLINLIEAMLSQRFLNRMTNISKSMKENGDE